jgi:hypothetical protein
MAGDVTFTVDLVANRDNFAPGAQKTVNDLNRIGQATDRVNSRTRNLSRLENAQSKTAKAMRDASFARLSLEEKITRLQQKQLTIGRQLERVGANAWRAGWLRTGQNQIGLQLMGLQAEQAAMAAAAGAKEEGGITRVLMRHLGIGHYAREARHLGVPLTFGNLAKVGGLALLASTPFIAAHQARTREGIGKTTGLSDKDVQGLQFASSASGIPIESLLEEWGGREKGGDFITWLQNNHPEIERLRGGGFRLGYGQSKAAGAFGHVVDLGKAQMGSAWRQFTGGLGSGAIGLGGLIAGTWANLASPFSSKAGEVGTSLWAAAMLKNDPEFAAASENAEKLNQKLGGKSSRQMRFESATMKEENRRIERKAKAEEFWGPRLEDLSKQYGYMQVGGAGADAMSRMGIYTSAGSATYSARLVKVMETVANEIHDLKVKMLSKMDRSEINL